MVVQKSYRLKMVKGKQEMSQTLKVVVLVWLSKFIEMKNLNFEKHLLRNRHTSYYVELYNILFYLRFACIESFYFVRQEIGLLQKYLLYIRRNYVNLIFCALYCLLCERIFNIHYKKLP